jgi:hypothetical protein
MAKQVTVIPSAQPVKVTAERPRWSNPGKLVPKTKAPVSFESSAVPQK